MIDFIHNLHAGSDALAENAPLPSGSLGDLAYGILRLPSNLFGLVELILEDFGSVRGE